LAIQRLDPVFKEDPFLIPTKNAGAQAETLEGRKRTAVLVMIPSEVGHVFRREVGHCSGMKPAIIPE
jgi:hypothetical protein